MFFSTEMAYMPGERNPLPPGEWKLEGWAESGVCPLMKGMRPDPTPDLGFLPSSAANTQQDSFQYLNMIQSM